MYVYCTHLSYWKKKKALPDTQLDFFFYVQGTDIIMDTVGSHSNWSEMIYRPF